MSAGLCDLAKLSCPPAFGRQAEARTPRRVDYDPGPLVTAWGWRWEDQYETFEDGPTGLVEFIPIIAGMEQGLPIPAANVLFGMRSATGTEFAVGPNLSPGGIGLTVAVGKTYRAGPMNLPINFALVSNADGLRYSITFGWNIRQ